MKTRLFSTFLALAMCLTLLPVAALAEEQELQTLINEATEGGTVTLAKDYTVADTSVTVNKNLTIDFSTFKVTGSLFNKGDGTENDNRYLIRIAEGKTVTFTNAKLDNNSGRAIEVGPGATLTLNGSNTDIKGADNTIVCVGTLEANGGQISCSSTSKSSSAILVGSTAYTSDNAKATIKNTTITNTTGGGVAAVKNSNVIIDAGTEITTGDHALNGNNLAPTQNITVKAGAVIKSNNEAAVYKAATGTLIIEGGTITGKGGIVCRAGTTTITGGTITAESTSNIPAGDAAWTFAPGAVVLDSSMTYDKNAVKVNISGGEFTAACDTSVVFNNPDSNDKGDAITLTGGTYSSDVNEFCDTANGYSAVKLGDDWRVGKFYDVTVAAPTNGTVTASGTAQMGDTVTLTVTPDEGYQLKTLTYKNSDDESVNPVTITDTSFEMPAYNVTVTAEFELATYNITVGTLSNGSVTPSNTAANMGEEITLTVTPATGYELATLTVTGPDNSPTDIKEAKKFTMPAGDVTINASFTETITPEITKYTVTVSASTNGSVTADLTSAAAGVAIKLTITPDSGYELETLTVTDADNADVTVTGAGNTRTFTMPAKNVTVTATFKSTTVTPDPVDLTLTADPATLTGGGKVTLTASEEVTSVTCEGVEVTGEGTTWTATLPNETKDYTFTATTADGETAEVTVTVTKKSTSTGSTGSTSTTTTTEKNDDGSTTTTKTNKVTGTITETTTYPDGSKTTVETNKDGSSETTTKLADGTTANVTVDTDGSTEAKVTVSEKAVTDAEGAAVMARFCVNLNK